VEVCTRRALLHGSQMGTSSVGGRASLTSLLAESDFTLASFLLSVLGEGSFLALLAFLDEYAPDPVTRQAAAGLGRQVLGEAGVAGGARRQVAGPPRIRPGVDTVAPRPRGWWSSRSSVRGPGVRTASTAGGLPPRRRTRGAAGRAG